MIGYSQQLVKANKSANQKLHGVKLGKLCIKKDIPVTVIASAVGVSRTAVYAWFKGESEISPPNHGRINTFLEKYLKETA